MELALRPCVTAGVALAGAALIAVTPVARPPLPDVQVPAVQLTASTSPFDLPSVPLVVQVSTGVLAAVELDTGVSTMPGGSDPAAQLPADLSQLLDVGALSALTALPMDLGTMLLSLIP
jgi:hypothetical protein